MRKVSRKKRIWRVGQEVTYTFLRSDELLGLSFALNGIVTEADEQIVVVNFTSRDIDMDLRVAPTDPNLQPRR